MFTYVICINLHGICRLSMLYFSAIKKCINFVADNGIRHDVVGWADKDIYFTSFQDDFQVETLFACRLSVRMIWIMYWYHFIIISIILIYEITYF